jgi:signal transduction histidine kinase
MQTTTIDHAEVSRHKCLIYEGQPSQQLSVVVPLLIGGLEDNWRCLYLGSPEMLEMADAALKNNGIDTETEARRRALIFSSDRRHLSGGKFDPGKMIDGLCDLIDGAVQDGFQGLCATGDMRWELGEDRNFDQLLDYEARLEQVFREKPLRGICQYHRDVVPAQAIRDALLTHRSAYIGDTLNRENWFYIPPELLLETEGGRHGEWMCQQIVRVQDAERKRDRALAALRESEAHQRRLAEQLAESNRDLDRRVAERTAELQVANQQLEAFSYSVSHDLRSPLMAITGFGELLAEQFGEALGARGREHLSRIHASARRMVDLIDGLLVLGRVTKADLVRSPVDLSALASEVAAEIRENEPGRSAEWIIHPGLHASGDRVLLRAVLANLLGNAWKFTSKKASPCIEVGKTQDEGSEVMFFVRDNGAGFAMEYADKLFSAFQRLHAQREFPGTGIGLATVQRIITKHGGRIWAESRPNEGATFFFTLPARWPFPSGGT